MSKFKDLNEKLNSGMLNTVILGVLSILTLITLAIVDDKFLDMTVFITNVVFFSAGLLSMKQDRMLKKLEETK